ncbi:MAG: anti-sigma factor family protein [Acidimicrobiia bacterium]
MTGVPVPDDRLSGYLDGELDATERAAVESFLARSDVWRGALAEVQWARDTVRALPWHDAPAGFWDDVSLESLGATAPHRWRHPLRVVAAAAAAAAAIAVFAVPLGDRDRDTERSNASTTVTSSPDRSTVQNESGGGAGDDTNLLQDMINVALDPFDW